jgi:Baseplate J-like protein
MPITIPSIDDRRYQDLLNEALARVPVYTPEWTNFNKSDPGVTLVEIFAFLTETLLYRSNQIPERNRRKFLKLLGVPLQAGSAAQGIVTISNYKGALAPTTLAPGLEVRSGAVSFRTTRGLDILPIEGRFFFKQSIPSPSPDILSYYQQLYASYRGTAPAIIPQLYQTTPFPLPDGTPVSLSDTIDGYLWLALCVRAADKPPASQMPAATRAIANRTLTIGVAPAIAGAQMMLPPGARFSDVSTVTLQVDAPKIDASGGLADSLNRQPQYQTLISSQSADIFTVPGVIDVTLPPQSQLALWNNLDPLEAGVDQLPPSLDDTALQDRIITWLRIRSSAATQAQFLWMGTNAVPVEQRIPVRGEILPAGTGEPDQSVTLARVPVLPGSVTVQVTANNSTDSWTEIDDLSSAGPEVPVPDPRLPPGVQPYVNPATKVFMLNAESGVVQFGDGMRGARPPEGAILRADYDYSLGAEGNVGAGSIAVATALPPGLTVANPIPTWGGADSESEPEGEKQIAGYLRHRDRLVTAQDFREIAMRTPGVNIGRVEVLPNYDPSLASSQPGDAAGAVTLMVVPAYDANQPDAPLPDRLFLDTICAYLDPRRLITTQVFLQGPNYRGIWISIGVKVLAGLNEAPVLEAVRQAVLGSLSPFTWALARPVIDLEIATAAARVDGVDFIQPPILIAEGDGPAVTQVAMSGLDLPRILGISVTSGSPADLGQLRGLTPATGGAGTGGSVVRIPAIPEECR